MTYSQYGQSEWILNLAKSLGITEGTVFEAGANNPYNISNSRCFLDQGWKALLVEARTKGCLDWEKFNHPRASIFNRKIRYVNRGLDEILDIVGAPYDLDVLFLDIDGGEHQLLREMSSYRPKIICVEYDNSYPLSIDFVPSFSKNSIESGQCSSIAMFRLMSSMGYVYINTFALDHVFVSQELFNQNSDHPDFKVFGQKAFSRIAPKHLYHFDKVLGSQLEGEGKKGIRFYRNKLNNLVVNQCYRDASHYFHFLSLIFASFGPLILKGRGEEYYEDYANELEAFNEEFVDSLAFH